MISPTLLVIVNVLLSQLSDATVKKDYDTIRNHTETIAQILLIQDKQKIYLRKYGQYLVALRFCESRFNDWAINPKDVDGTRSYGRYQYKPGTFRNFSKLYGISGELMDGDTQELITVQMIKNGENLQQQFPACHRRYGWLLNTQVVQR